MKQYTNTGRGRNSKVYLVAEHADHDELPEDLITKCTLAEIAKRTDEGGGHRIFQEHEHDDAQAFAERVVLSGLARRGIQKMPHTDSTYHTVDGVVVFAVDKRGKVLDSNFTANRGNKQRHLASEWAKKNQETKPIAGEDSMNAIASVVKFTDWFTDAKLSAPEGFELNEWGEYLCAKLIKVEPGEPADKPIETRADFWEFQRAQWLHENGISKETKENIATAEKWLNNGKSKTACPVCGVVVGKLKAEKLMHLRSGCGDPVKKHFANVQFIDKKAKSKKK